MSGTLRAGFSDGLAKRGGGRSAGFQPGESTPLIVWPSGPEVFGSGVDGSVCVGRGEWIIFGVRAEMSADGVRVDVLTMGAEVAWVFDTAFCEAIFPDGHFGLEAEREASFDVLHGLLNGDIGRGRKEEVKVVGHEHEGVNCIAAPGAVVVHQVEEEICVGVGLEEAAAVGGDGGDEESADFLRGSLHKSKL